MKEKSTYELDEMLQKIEPDKLEHYYKENDDHMADTKKAFTYYMKDMIKRKNVINGNRNLRYKDIYSFSGVSESYGEKILNMEKRTKNRDLILRFCIVAHFQLNEIKPLYAKDKRMITIALIVKVKGSAFLSAVCIKKSGIQIQNNSLWHLNTVNFPPEYSGNRKELV